LGKRKKEIWK